MKKIILFIFISAFLSITAQAQNTFAVTPSNDFNVSTPISNNIVDELISDVYFNNITSNNIKLKWKVLERNIPADWDYSMCDYQTCRSNFLDSAEYTMYPIDQTTKAYLLFHVLPHSVGMATLKVCVYDVNFPNNCQTISWTVNSTTGINELNADLHLSIFPNPTSDFMNIQGENINLKNSKIYLYNSLGEELISTVCNSNSYKLNLASFNEGIYLLKIATTEGVTTKKIIVSR